MSNEEKVRAAWPNVSAMWSNSVSQPTFCLSLGVIWHDGLSVGYFKTEAEAYSAAAAYTDEVLAEAARMRAEITQIECDIIRSTKEREQWAAGRMDVLADSWNEAVSCYTRILSRLQSLYEQHVRGLKSEALKGTQ